MTTKDEALKLALEALEKLNLYEHDLGEEITTIKEALAQPTIKQSLTVEQKWTSEDTAYRPGGLAQPEQERKEFESVVRPVIEWLNAHWHPHVTVVITPTSAELSVGEIAYSTTEFIRD